MKYTFITGSTGGLGKAYAHECARRGYNLFLTGTKEEKLSALCVKLAKLFPNIKIIYKRCDLTSEEQRCELVNFAKQNDIKINRFVANAGIDFEGPILEKTPDEILRVIKVNCEATIHMFNMLLIERDESEKFYTIVVSSLAGYFSMPQKAIYSASKAMLTNFFISMHEELKEENVNVTIVCPGGMPTTQEMINSIESQGLSGKLSSTPMEVVATKSLNLSQKNKAVYIPGWFNRFLKRVSMPFSRLFVARKINGRWKKTREKAKKLGN